MTNRPTNPSTSREDKPKAETPETPDFSKFEVHDSYHTPVMDNANAGGGKEKTKLSRQKLIELDANLSDRDKEILSAIREYRYLLSSQIRRLLFMDAATPSAALRAANRNLRKLKEKGLIDSLSRRIGGVRSGSSGLVWRITHAGERLLHLHDDVPYRVTSRFFEPSPYFLAHTLAVAETAVRLKELSRSGQIKTTALQLEPECWRSYSECGTTLALKPDLYAAVISGGYEDRYFIEVDLDTESVAKVLEKCVRYHKYYRSGLEQEETDMFPLTIWLAPNVKRKARLIEAIKAEFDKQPKLFAVITSDELEHLVCSGGDSSTLC